MFWSCTTIISRKQFDHSEPNDTCSSTIPPRIGHNSKINRNDKFTPSSQFAVFSIIHFPLRAENQKRFIPLRLLFFLFPRKASLFVGDKSRTLLPPYCCYNLGNLSTFTFTVQRSCCADAEQDRLHHRIIWRPFLECCSADARIMMDRLIYWSCK